MTVLTSPATRRRGGLTAARTQRVLGCIFLSLGAWCFMAPEQVQLLALRPGFGNATSALLMGAFGAQAMLVGIAVLCARFNAQGFVWFGVATLLLFLAFDAAFGAMQMNGGGLWLGAAGSAAVLGLALHGARQAAREHRRSRRYILARLASITDPRA